MPKRLNKLILSAFVLAAAAVTPACKKGGAEITAPEPPTYDNPFDELKDMPNQANAQIEWVKQPLVDASNLGAEFEALKAKFNFDIEQFGGMVSAAFTEGKIEVTVDLSAVGDVAAEAKAEVEAFLNKVKASGEAVLTIPKRAKMAASAIGKMPLKAPTLATKATSYLKAEISNATAEVKAELEAKLGEIPTLVTNVKNMAPDAVAKVKAVPQESQQIIADLKAAFAGKGSFPSIPGGSGSAEFSAEASVDAEAGADAAAE
ncbi:MAG TPA: hypothetical protein VIK91_15990 [Nannocystis sp.]